MEPRRDKSASLLFLSDLWGGARSEWWAYYVKPLREKFEVRVHDSRALAGIDPHLTDQEEIHRRFIHGGLERAAGALIERERDGDPPYVLAFSIGGTIAWRAVAAGLSCGFFVAVSSTRLRKESVPLTVPGRLIYGEQDAFRPNDEWLAKQINFTRKMIPGVGHECYRSPEFAAREVSALLRRGRKTLRPYRHPSNQ